MGLQDREYLHRREPPFSPPDAGPSTLTIVLLLVAVVFALFKGYEWLLEQRATKRHAVRPPTVAVEPQLPAVSPEITPQVQAPAWTRCEVAGRVMYSDNACLVLPQGTGARPASAQSVQQAPTESASHTTTLYHCKAYNGATFWASSHCNQHQALVDRLVSVPSTLPFKQQVALAETNRSAAAAQASNNATSYGSSGVDTSNRVECQALNEQVARWDAMARQPQTGQMQDWIREQRKKARDRQFALRC